MQPPRHVRRADRAFWCKPTAVLLVELEARLTGLTEEEAERRLRVDGRDLFEAVHGEVFLVKIGKRVLNPLVALLIAAAAVSGISGDYGSFFIIVAVLALSMTLDIVQQYRAEQEAEALRHSVAVYADVMRDRKQVEQPVGALVPGDIVLLRTGDLVPADGIVLESEDLQLDESIMTGEPFPARKNSTPCTATEAADAHNALFAEAFLMEIPLKSWVRIEICRPSSLCEDDPNDPVDLRLSGCEQFCTFFTSTWA